MNMRNSVRAQLHSSVRIRGMDALGKSLEIVGESIDFSRKGLGVRVDSDRLAPGSRVTVDLPRKMRSEAVIQWTRRDSETGSVRLGLRLLNPQPSFAFRVAACLLLSMAMLSQFSLARPRPAARGAPSSSCTMGLGQMKTMLEKALGGQSVLSESEKAFIHIQHQHLSCSEFTRMFEKSDFFSQKREAVADWHRHTYHAKDEQVRTAAIQDAEVVLGGAQ